MFEPSVFLSDIGLPHIQLFESGRMFDHQSQVERRAQKNGQVELLSPITGKRVRGSIDHLIGYYFKAPWAQRVEVPYRDLSPLGFPGYFVTIDGRVFSLHGCDYLVGNLSFDGYHRVLMTSTDSGSPKTMIVHRLVALMFLPNPEGRSEVNHIDGDKLNNHAHNLEWVWPRENMEHALNNGLRKRALSDDMIHAICQRLEQGRSVKEIMVELDLPKHHVLGIKSGCHERISEHYQIPRNKRFSTKS